MARQRPQAAPRQRARGDPLEGRGDPAGGPAAGGLGGAAGPGRFVGGEPRNDGASAHRHDATPGRRPPGQGRGAARHRPEDALPEDHRVRDRARRVQVRTPRASYAGDTSIDRTIQFNGSVFPASTRVVSDLDLHYARLGWIWQLPVIPDKLRVGPVVEAKAFVASATLDAPATTPRLRETERVAVVIPSAGLALDLSLHPLIDLFAEGSALTLGDRGRVIDAEAGVRVHLVKFLTMIAGYRFFEVRGEEDHSFARLQLSGPFVGVTFRF